MGKNYILCFGRKHALNTLIFSVLRNLWSGISCYSCNRFNFFLFHRIFCMWFSLHFASQSPLRKPGSFRMYFQHYTYNIYLFSLCLRRPAYIVFVPIQVLLYLLGKSWVLSLYVFQFMPLNR